MHVSVAICGDVNTRAFSESQSKPRYIREVLTKNSPLHLRRTQRPGLKNTILLARIESERCLSSPKRTFTEDGVYKNEKGGKKAAGKLQKQRLRLSLPYFRQVF